MRNNVVILVLSVFLLALVPAATANSVAYSLSCGGTSCGKVKITDLTTGGVSIKVTMTGGYSIQASSNNSFTLNTGTGLTLSLSSFSTTEFGSTTASMNAKVNDGAGKFTWGITKFNIPNGKTSVSGFTATVLGVSTADLLANNNGNIVSVHYCTPVGGSLSLNCSPNTAFANSTPIPSVPEPGTLSLLGTGLIGLAGLVRRRLIG